MVIKGYAENTKASDRHKEMECFTRIQQYYVDEWSNTT